MIYQKRGHLFSIIGLATIILLILGLCILPYQTRNGAVFIISFVVLLLVSLVVLLNGLLNYEKYLSSSDAMQKRHKKKEAILGSGSHKSLTISIQNLYYYLHNKRLGNELFIRLGEKNYIIGRKYARNYDGDLQKSIFYFEDQRFATFTELISDTTLLGYPLNNLSSIVLLLDGKKDPQEIRRLKKEKIDFRFAKIKKSRLLFGTGFTLTILGVVMMIMTCVIEGSTPRIYEDVEGKVKEIKSENRKYVIELFSDECRYQIGGVQYSIFPYNEIKAEVDKGNSFVGKDVVMKIRSRHVFREKNIDVVAAYIFAINIDGVDYITLEQSHELRQKDFLKGIQYCSLAIVCGIMGFTADYYYNNYKFTKFREADRDENRKEFVEK